MPLHSKIVEFRVLQDAVKDVLDRWFLGVIILRDDQQVLFMNKAATNILSKGDGLLRRRGGFRAMFPEETEKLSALLRSATLATSGRSRAGGVMALSRASTRRPLHIFVAALASGEGTSDGAGVCAIFVGDPEARADIDEGLLRSLYGLTAAEAKVAVLLVQGDDALGVSKRLAVSFNTARTHMKRVFEKTSSSRQSELVHLILCGPLSARLRG